MILSFKYQFVEPIESGTKIHTIREDKNGRWKPGTKIQFWQGNPRNVRSKISPYQFGLGECTDLKYIYLNFQFNIIEITGIKYEFYIKISTTEKLNLFANNDGFESWEKMKDWFFFNHNKPEFFKGKLIYFKADTSFSVSENQDTITCYGETYKVQSGCCNTECELDKKNKCNKTPCVGYERKDKKITCIYKKVKTHGTR